MFLITDPSQKYKFLFEFCEFIAVFSEVFSLEQRGHLEMHGVVGV